MFPVENHHAHQHQTLSCADYCQAKRKAVSICRISSFKISNKVNLEAWSHIRGYNLFQRSFITILNCSGSLSHIFPLSKATGSRVMSPKSRPICFSETARGKRGQPQISQQGCCAVFGPIYSPNPWLLLLISWLRLQEAVSKTGCFADL